MRFSTATTHMVNTSLMALTGDPGVMDCATVEDAIMHLSSSGFLHLPVDPGDVVWVDRRIPIFADIQRSKSILFAILYDNFGRTVLVCDSILSGKEALYLATLNPVMSQWLSETTPGLIDIHFKNIDMNDAVAIAKLKSYVTV